MKYKGKKVEIIGRNEIFGKNVLWIHILEDGTYRQVLQEDLEEDVPYKDGLAYVRFIAVATKIKEEIARKHILAPYESSLIPLPHQILVLEKVMMGAQTRYLLADEVGMGKTIEAGLILKEKKLRGEVKRALLIVPKSAMIQWQDELKRHFGESFVIYDNDFITSMTKAFISFDSGNELNFWRQHNQIIVSSDALKPLDSRAGWSQEKVDAYNKYRLEAVAGADFDMIIIDEAHKMGGATNTVSRYKMAEVLCNSVPNLLLLTATPHRGKSDHFRRILQLIDADAFSGEGMPSINEIQPYVMRSEKRFAVDYDGKKLFNKRNTIRFEVNLDENRHAGQLSLYNHITDYVRICFGRAKAKKRNSTGLIMVMLQKLASSSTAAILSALKTRLARLENKEDEDDIEGYGLDSTFDYDQEMLVSDYSVMNNNSSQFDEITMLHDLISEADNCMNAEVDAKASALIDKIFSLRASAHDDKLKILVFTEFRQTQEYLLHLLKANGLTCSYVNGSMSLEERQAALIMFSEQSDVMVATDVAGESLNMQFCHIVINYDLPWNPMALEQRIGRVDRIGQKHEVEAYNMFTNNSVDSRIYEIIVEKLDLIMNELGINKTNDVLDSTIDVKKINHLYLQSLLNPERFDFFSDGWLFDIEKKLNNYQSKEGVLPTISREEINALSAAEVRYSPLPIWLENLMTFYCQSYGFQLRKKSRGITEYDLGKDGIIKGVFEADKAGDNPAVEQISLQHPVIRKLLSEVDIDTHGKIPVIQSKEGKETPGYLSIWKITALNEKESKEAYTAQFITDQGRVFAPYANNLWNKLIQDNCTFTQTGWTKYNISINDNTHLKNNLYSVFRRMEESIQAEVEDVARKKLHALDYNESRIQRIGIENIRKSKMQKLQQEKDEWQEAFRSAKHVIADVKHIITIRIEQ